MLNWLNPANLLTLVRIAVMPVLIHAILDGRNERALWVLFVAALTDAADGAVARRFEFKSRFGAYLDPIADKLLLVGIYLALAFIGRAPVWLVAMIFVRDVLIVLVAAIGLFFLGRSSYPPSLWGKASTFFQLTYALALMAHNVWPGSPTRWLESPLMLAVAVFTTVSGLHYCWRAWRGGQPEASTFSKPRIQ